MRQSRSAIHWLLRLVPVAVAVTAATCTTFDSTQFTPHLEQAFSSRAIPATDTTAEERALLAQGYVSIGTLSVQREGSVDTTAICRAEAPKRGADLIRITENNVRDTRYPTGRRCAQTSTTLTAEYVCPVGASCYSRQVSREVCVRYETVTGAGVAVVRSTATFYRKEPKLAAERIRAYDLPAAIDKHDVAKVQSLLKTAEEANLPMVTGAFPLDAAVQAGNAKVVAAVLAIGAQPNRADPGSKDTALTRAITAPDANPDVVRTLLEKGAKTDVVVPNTNQTVPLYVAAKGTIAMMAALLSGGAPINAQEQYSRAAPLHAAVAAENLEMVNFLLSKGADVRIADQNAEQPIHYAAKRKNVKVLEALVKAGTDTNALGYHEQTPLIYAAVGGSLAAAQFLIDHGANVNAVSRGDVNQSLCCSAMSAAVRGSQPEIVAALIKAGAKDIQPATSVVSVIPKSTDSSIFTAAAAGDVAAVTKLLDSGTSPNIVDGDKNSPLMKAAEKGRTEVVRLLLDRGADVSYRSTTGGALAYAALNFNEATVKLLVERGADPNDQTFLRSTALMLTAEKGRLELVKLLVERGADVNRVGYLQQTALTKAATFGHVETVRYLLDKGANPNATDNKGKTIIAQVVDTKGVWGGKANMEAIIVLLKSKGGE